jgi:hypothetical protein
MHKITRQRLQLKMTTGSKKEKQIPAVFQPQLHYMRERQIGISL